MVNVTIIILCVLINTGQKIRRTKFSPARPGGEIGENFLLAKISGSMVLHIHVLFYSSSPLVVVF